MTLQVPYRCWSATRCHVEMLRRPIAPTWSTPNPHSLHQRFTQKTPARCYHEHILRRCLTTRMHANAPHSRPEHVRSPIADDRRTESPTTRWTLDRSIPEPGRRTCQSVSPDNFPTSEDDVNDNRGHLPPGSHATHSEPRGPSWQSFEWEKRTVLGRKISGWSRLPKSCNPASFWQTVIRPSARPALLLPSDKEWPRRM